MAVSRRQKAARGVLVVILLKVTGTGIARLAQLVIPLFLLPTDLGIFALAAVFSGLLLLVGELGLTTELLRRRERVSETMNTAFVLRTVLGLGLLGASVPVAYGVALAYREAQVALPIVVLSLGLLFHAVVMVPRVVAARDLDFRRSLAPDSVGKYTVSIATIGFAVLGLAFWSPVFGTLLGYGVGTVLQLAVTKWRPRWEFRADLARSLLRFGRYITLATLMTSVAQSLDTAVVGLLLGVGSLGVYALALSWGVFLTSNLSSVFSTVAYPVLAEASDAPARMRRAFLENLRYYTYLAVALSLGVVVFAPLFVTALYAAQWGPAIVPMQILAVGGLLMGYGQVASDTLYALGQPRKVLLAAVAQAGVLVGALLTGTLVFGILGTSVAVVLGTAVVAVAMMRPAGKAAGVPLREGIAITARPLASGAIAAIAGLAATWVVPPTLPGLLIAGAVFLGTYIAALQGLTRGGFLAEVRKMLRLAVT